MVYPFSQRGVARGGALPLTTARWETPACIIPDAPVDGQDPICSALFAPDHGHRHGKETSSSLLSFIHAPPPHLPSPPQILSPLPTPRSNFPPPPPTPNPIDLRWDSTVPSKPTPVTGHGGDGPHRRRCADHERGTRQIAQRRRDDAAPHGVHLQQPRHGWPLHELLPPLQFVRVAAPLHLLHDPALRLSLTSPSRFQLMTSTFSISPR